MSKDSSVKISASGGVTIKVFSGEDEDWKDRIKLLISLKKLGHVLEESFKLPNPDTKGQYTDEQQKLIDDNTMAATWIDFCDN